MLGHRRLVVEIGGFEVVAGDRSCAFASVDRTAVSLCFLEFFPVIPTLACSALCRVKCAALIPFASRLLTNLTSQTFS